MSFTWENGRQLKSMSGIGLNASFSYNADGVRTKKVVNGTEHIYDVSGSQILREKVNGNTLYYLPDENGRYYGIRLVDSAGVVCYYFYVFNLQGDVIGVIDGAGNYAAKYTYDTWGKLLTVTDGSGNDVSANSGHIANLNPIRYRGYYYDVGTGFYYCGSRYYDPEIGRFINADAVLDNRYQIGNNLFAYCANNPINHHDINGYFIGALVGGAIGGLGGLISGGISAAIKGEDILSGAASGALGGMVGGAIAGAIVDIFVVPGSSIVTAVAIGSVAGVIGGATSSAVSQTSEYYFKHGNLKGFKLDIKSILISAGYGAIFSGMGSGFAQAQSIFYGNDKLVGAMAGAFFDIGGAAADIASSILSTMLKQTTEAILGITPNPYNLNITDLLQINKAKLAISGR